MSRPELYFAYGSNLNQEDLSRWCRERSLPYPLAGPPLPAYLPDHRPAFSCFSAARGGGVLNVLPQRGWATPGALFRLAPKGAKVLDRKENHPKTYLKAIALALTPDGREWECFTYMVAPEMVREHVTPSDHYLGLAVEGLNRLGLSPAQLTAAAHNRPSPPLANHLFVYGTLQRGHSNHGLLSDPATARFVSPARVPGRLTDLGAYPGLLPAGEGDGRVEGELYHLTDPGHVLEATDRLEDFQGFGAGGNIYRRALALAELPEGPPVLTWVYVYLDDPPGRLLAEGRWPA